MERTKKSNEISVEKQIQTLASALVARANFSAALGGSQYSGDRDIYQALGYAKSITYEDYAARYLRQDMAKAVIDRPAKATWQGGITLEEAKRADETPFEKAWRELDRDQKVKDKFSRVDRLAAIGCYGVLLLGLDDVKKQEDFAKPVSVGKRKLLYLSPYGEGNASISTVETDTTNPRYGKPLLYTIKVPDLTGGSTSSGNTVATISTSLIVHHTRIIHVVDDVLENEIIGIPRLEAIFNRLVDLEKIIGGDAEMFWRGARPGFQGKVDPDFVLTEEVKNDLKDQISEYEHNLRRILLNQGVEYKALDQQISDPTHHVDIQIQMISAVTGIPKRILTGSERGELSSNQDSNEYRTYVKTRREDHAEVHIVRPFVDRMVELAIMPKPSTDDYAVVWSDLFAVSEKELADIGRSRSEALRNYITSPMAETVISPQSFLQFFLGFTPHQLELISQMTGTEITAEELLYAKESAMQMKQGPVKQEAKSTPDKTNQDPSVK